MNMQKTSMTLDQSLVLENGEVILSRSTKDHSPYSLESPSFKVELMEEVSSFAPSLSLGEIKINDVLEQLSSFILTPQTRSSKKKVRFSEYLVVGGLPIITVLALSGANMIDKWLGGSPGSLWSLLVWLGISAPLIFLLFYGSDKLTESLSVSLNSPKIVNERKSLIQKAIALCTSSVLKERLAEIYFLTDNDNIDQKFWFMLVLVLTEFCDKNEPSVSLKNIEDLRSQYRNDVGLV